MVSTGPLEHAPQPPAPRASEPILTAPEPDATGTTADTGWIVSIQHWAGHPLFTKRRAPPVTTEWFAEREQAEARKRQLRGLHPDIAQTLICVTPAPHTFRKKEKRS